MKQFLRYQISGTVFLFWLLLFYLGKDSKDLITLVMSILNKKNDLNIALLFISALPLGIVIHQVSVSIKNLLSFLPWFRNLSDFPKQEIIESNNAAKNYILERISNINTYYYVRVDNGFLAPLFAWLIIKFGLGIETSSYLLLTAVIIFILLIPYIWRLILEMNKYHEIIHNKVNRDNKA